MENIKKKNQQKTDKILEECILKYPNSTREFSIKLEQRIKTIMCSQIVECNAIIEGQAEEVKNQIYEAREKLCPSAEECIYREETTDLITVNSAWRIVMYIATQQISKRTTTTLIDFHNNELE